MVRGSINKSDNVPEVDVTRRMKVAARCEEGGGSTSSPIGSTPTLRNVTQSSHYKTLITVSVMCLVWESYTLQRSALFGYLRNDEIWSTCLDFTITRV